jgi:hypothetical protein
MSDTAKRRGRPPKTLVEAIADNNLPSEADNFTPVRERPTMRPAMREEDPRVSAARRAAEIRGHLGSMDEGEDKFRMMN